MSAEPYYTDETTTLYLGDHRDVLPALGMTFDLIVADPPYGETSLEWDTWPFEWPVMIDHYARSVCIEKRESQCEASAKRLSQGVLDFGGVA